MINALSDYTESGARAGQARNENDEPRALAEIHWARRAINLESGDYRQQAQNAFDAAYKAARKR